MGRREVVGLDVLDFSTIGYEEVSTVVVDVLGGALWQWGCGVRAV